MLTAPSGQGALAREPVVDTERNSNVPAEAGEGLANRWRIGLGSGFVYGLTEYAQSRGDISYSARSDYVDVSASVARQLAPDSSLGLRGSWAHQIAKRTDLHNWKIEPEARHLLDLGAEFRYQPGGSSGAYFSAGLGLAMLSSRAGSRSTEALGPLVGVAGGYDLSVHERLSLGLEARGRYASLSSSSIGGGDDANLFFTLGVTAQFDIGPSSRVSRPSLATR